MNEGISLSLSHQSGSEAGGAGGVESDSVLVAYCSMCTEGIREKVKRKRDFRPSHRPMSLFYKVVLILLLSEVPEGMYSDGLSICNTCRKICTTQNRSSRWR